MTKEYSSTVQITEVPHMPTKKRGADKNKEVKLAPLNMRTTRSLRIRLEEAAHVSGRSLTQEVETRLSDSFNKINCYNCSAELICGGDHDIDDEKSEEFCIETKLSCPNCNAFYLMYLPKEDNND